MVDSAPVKCTVTVAYLLPVKAMIARREHIRIEVSAKTISLCVDACNHLDRTPSLPTVRSTSKPDQRLTQHHPARHPLLPHHPTPATPAILAQRPPPIRIRKPLVRQIILRLLAAPRKRTRKPPRRVKLVHHHLHQLKVLWLLDRRLGENGVELCFCGGAVVGRGCGGVLVEGEEVGVGCGDDIVVS